VRIGAAGLVLLLALCGCRSGSAATGRTPVAEVPPTWRAARAGLLDLEALGATQGAGAVRQRAGPALEAGLGLLRATVPNDVAAADVPRWRAGRTAFGRALARFAQAIEDGADDATVLRSLRDSRWTLEAWFEAAQGLSPQVRF